MTSLVINNLPLVNYVIKNMEIFNSFDYEDLYQVGVIGLVNAASTFKKDLNNSFSTYAYACIKNEILKYLRKNSNTYLSLEEEIADNLVILDTIPDNEPEILDKLISNETDSEINRAINENLNIIESSIIKMLYGIDCNEYKQIEIAGMLQIPQYKIARLKKRILNKLKKCLV